MKCTNRICAFLLCIAMIICFAGCKSESKNTYEYVADSNRYHITTSASASGNPFFAADSCVTDQNDFGTDQVDSFVAQGGGVFNLATGECTYGQNLFGKMYPASTTKILTCLVALEEGNLDQMITVSDYAADQTPDSSVANLEAGDVMSLRDLLFGLMLRSGNDAALAIAEGVGGSEEEFAELMNKKAHEIGATNSHFVTPHGLHVDDHYTSVYDMYLIFQEALKNEKFVEIINTGNYHTTYTNIDGEVKEQDWYNTNRYLTGKEIAPYGFTVIGGKTGTTYEAGYCLVLYSKNDQDQPIISIVYFADCSLNLYYLMNELLYTFGEAT